MTVEVIFFQKILSCVSICNKDFKKHFLIKVSIKNLSEYFFRQLKLHQHKIRTKTGISLEITLNVCKCLIASLVLIKFLLWQQHHFCLFQLVPCLSVNLPWSQECIFYCALRKEEVHSSSWGHRYTHSPAQLLKRFKPLPVSILLWQGHCWIGKYTNKEFNRVYGVCNLTK